MTRDDVIGIIRDVLLFETKQAKLHDVVVIDTPIMLVQLHNRLGLIIGIGANKIWPYRVQFGDNIIFDSTILSRDEFEVIGEL
jgi:hypothetical protein